MYNHTEYEQVPGHLLDALDAHAKEGQLTGDFLKSVLESDLQLAVAHADPQSMAVLKQLVTYVNCQLPIGCWGNKERVSEWKAKMRGEETPKVLREALRKEMLKLAPRVDSWELDVLVNRCKAQEADEINNSGVEAQLNYLTDWTKPDEVINLIAETRANDGV